MWSHGSGIGAPYTALTLRQNSDEYAVFHASGTRSRTIFGD
jgi:hypothetical protein